MQQRRSSGLARIPRSESAHILPAVLLAASFWFAGCELEAGAIDNEEQTGWQERGRDPGEYQADRQWNAEKEAWTWTYALNYTDIILSPDGNTLLAMVPLPGPEEGFDRPGMALMAQRLPDGQRQLFPQLLNVERINFSPDGLVAYLLMEGGTSLTVLDLQSYAVSQTYWMPVPFTVVDPTPDGRFLVLSNLPTTDWEELLVGTSCAPTVSLGGVHDISRCDLGFVDLAAQQYWTVQTSVAIRDIDFSTQHGEVLLTYSEWLGQASVATMKFYSPEKRLFTGSARMENCADEVVLDRVRGLAVLSPTSCAKDPISIIDLKSRQALRTLPGFGPVVVSESLGKAVGFTRKQDMEQTWGYYGQNMDFGLIFVDLETGDWTVMDYGKNIPSYTLSPDGRYVYLYENHTDQVQQPDGSWKWEQAPSNLSFVDLTTMKRLPVDRQGPRLDRFVWSQDGGTLFVLDDGKLFSIPVGEMQFSPLPVLGTPELLNIRPQGDMLLLGEANEPKFYLLPLNDLFGGVGRPGALSVLDLSL